MKVMGWQYDKINVSGFQLIISKDIFDKNNDMIVGIIKPGISGYSAIQICIGNVPKIEIQSDWLKPPGGIYGFMQTPIKFKDKRKISIRVLDWRDGLI